MAPPGCTGRDAAQGPIAALVTPHGHGLHICLWEAGSPGQVKKLVVDVGASRLMSGVGDAMDAAWLLSLAATFEPSK
jgi:hypothetical protein